MNINSINKYGYMNNKIVNIKYNKNIMIMIQWEYCEYDIIEEYENQEVETKAKKSDGSSQKDSKHMESCS